MAKRSGSPSDPSPKAPRRPRRRKASAPKDVAIVVDRTPDNEGFQVLRRRGEDQPVELGTIRPLREGKPIDGEVVSLSQRDEAPFLFDVETQVDARRATSAGPAQVATDAYRAGWDAVFGTNKPATALN